MNSTRVYLRGLDPLKTVERFDGLLSDILFPEALNYLVRSVTDHPDESELLRDWLIVNKVAVLKDDKMHLTIPVLTVGFAEEILSQISHLDATPFVEIARDMAKKIENWQDVGINFLAQVVFGGLFYRLWKKRSRYSHEPSAFVVTDIDQSPLLIPDVKPLVGDETISFLQTYLLGDANLIYNTLNNPLVVKSLATIDENYFFIAIDNTPHFLRELRIYRNKSIDTNITMPQLTLDKIGVREINLLGTELKRITECFAAQSEELEAIAAESYIDRREVFRFVDYSLYRDLFFYVFGHYLLATTFKAGVFPGFELKKAPVKDDRIELREN